LRRGNGFRAPQRAITTKVACVANLNQWQLAKCPPSTLSQIKANAHSSLSEENRRVSWFGLITGSSRSGGRQKSDIENKKRRSVSNANTSWHCPCLHCVVNWRIDSICGMRNGKEPVQQTADP
jgi:hypothetical protein